MAWEWPSSTNSGALRLLVASDRGVGLLTGGQLLLSGLGEADSAAVLPSRQSLSRCKSCSLLDWLSPWASVSPACCVSGSTWFGPFRGQSLGSQAGPKMHPLIGLVLS